MFTSASAPSTVRWFQPALLFAAACASTSRLPELPAGKCVFDETHQLRRETEETLQGICLALHVSGKGQLVIGMVSDLHGRRSKEELALDLFRQIGLGHRDRDDGVIVLAQPGRVGHRWIRVTIGYGLEGGMTDDRIGALLDEIAVPRIREGDWDGALVGVSKRLHEMVIEEDASGRIELHAQQRRREREKSADR